MNFISKAFFTSSASFLILSSLSAQPGIVPTVQQMTNVIQPSANNAAVIKYSDVPVNLSTGTTAITVPLLSLPSKRLTQDISLSYNSSGIKLDERESVAGLGWSLNAGGSITRVVRGLPDESDYGFCGKKYVGLTIALYSQMKLESTDIKRGPDAPVYIRVDNTLDQTGPESNLAAFWDGTTWGNIASSGTDPASGNAVHELLAFALALGFGGTPYANQSNTTQFINTENDLRNHIESGKYDSEPDVFYFNTGTVSGKFIINEYGDPVLIPYQDVKIEPAIGRKGQGYWTIIDQSGNKFTFGQNRPEITTTTTSTTFAQRDFGSFSTTNLNISYNSAWYLDNIVSAYNDETVNFTYQYLGTVANTSTTYSRQEAVIPDNSNGKPVWDQYVNFNCDLSGCYCTYPDINSVDTYITTTSTFVYSISTISSSFGQIHVYYRQNNSGATYSSPFVLDNMVLNDAEGITIKKLTFNFVPFITYTTIDVPTGNTTADKRLALSKITGYDKTATVPMPPYQFFYNTTVDPAFTSDFWLNSNKYANQQDAWGYLYCYSQTQLSHTLPIGPQTYTNPDLVNFPGKGIITCLPQGTGPMPGVNKFPTTNPNVQCFSLNRMISPLGAQTDFQYEANDYFDAVSQSNKYAGGLRIKKIITSDINRSQTPAVISKYTYRDPDNSSNSSGVLNYLPSFSFKYNISGDEWISEGAVSGPTFDVLSRFSTSYTDLGINNTAAVIYQYVKEEKGLNNGYTWYNFSTINDRPDYIWVTDPNNSNQKIKKTYRNSGDNCCNTCDNCIQLPRTDMGFERGLLLTKLLFNQSDNIVSLISYHYDFSQFSNFHTEVIGVRSLNTTASDNNSWSVANSDGSNQSLINSEAIWASDRNLAAYSNISEWVRLSGTTTTLYEYPNGTTQPSVSISTSQYYGYSKYHTLPFAVKTVHPDGNITYVKTAYAFDYIPNNDFIADLQAKNIKNAPVEIINSTRQINNQSVSSGSSSVSIPNGEYFISGEVHTYKRNTCLPDQVFVLEGTPILNSSLAFPTVNPFDFSTSSLTSPVEENDTDPDLGGPIAGDPGNTDLIFNQIRSIFFPDVRYKTRVAYEIYDADRNLVQIRKDNATATSFIWGENRTDTGGNVLPIAKIANAENNKTAYTSFESNAKGGWVYNKETTEQLNAYHSFSGTLTRNLPLCTNCIGSYDVSFIARGSGTVTVNGTPVTINSEIWTSYKSSFSDNNVSLLTITTSAGVYIDNVSLVQNESATIFGTDFENPGNSTITTNGMYNWVYDGDPINTYLGLRWNCLLAPITGPNGVAGYSFDGALDYDSEGGPNGDGGCDGGFTPSITPFFYSAPYNYNSTFNTFVNNSDIFATEPNGQTMIIVSFAARLKPSVNSGAITANVNLIGSPYSLNFPRATDSPLSSNWATYSFTMALDDFYYLHLVPNNVYIDDIKISYVASGIVSATSFESQSDGWIYSNSSVVYNVDAITNHTVNQLNAYHYFSGTLTKDLTPCTTCSGNYQVSFTARGSGTITVNGFPVAVNAATWTPYQSSFSDNNVSLLTITTSAGVYIDNVNIVQIDPSTLFGTNFENPSSSSTTANTMYDWVYNGDVSNTYLGLRWNCLLTSVNVSSTAGAGGYVFDGASDYDSEGGTNGNGGCAGGFSSSISPYFYASPYNYNSTFNTFVNNSDIFTTEPDGQTMIIVSFAAMLKPSATNGIIIANVNRFGSPYSLNFPGTSGLPLSNSSWQYYTFNMALDDFYSLRFNLSNVYIDDIKILYNVTTQISSTDFESQSEGWHYSNSSTVYKIDAVTGERFFVGHISKVAQTVDATDVTKNRKYKLSFWTFGVGTVLLNAGSVQQSFTSSSTTQWTLHEIILSATDAAAAIAIDSRIVDGQGKISSEVYIDELRLHPVDAIMTTYTYNPLIGKSSETDPNNRTVYYEYDNLNRVRLIKDHNRNIIKKFDYQLTNGTVKVQSAALD